MTPKGIEITIHPEWEVHPAQVKECLDKKTEMLLLDVRQQREWDFARIAGAMLIPLGQLQGRAEAELGPWKKKPIVVYCHVGARSLNAAAILRQHGFEDVHSLAGGIDGWSLMVDASVPRY
jgi:rhodanese-related sulfurtransferase